MQDYQLHQCHQLPIQGIQIIQNIEYQGFDEKSWCLQIIREASEEDLEESTYFNEVGETIWETIIEISHCPYCGDLLPDSHGSPEKFIHFDYSSWHVKRT